MTDAPKDPAWITEEVTHAAWEIMAGNVTVDMLRAFAFRVAARALEEMAEERSDAEAGGETT